MVAEVPMTDARAHMADLANRVVYGGERVVLTRHGRPFAALVSVQDLARLERAESPGEAPSSSEVTELGSSPEAYPRSIAASYSRPADPGGISPGDSR